jgi:hypothetical protein
MFLRNLKAIAACVAAVAQVGESKGFLTEDHSQLTAQMLDKDLQTAMEEIMGCGSRKVAPEALERIKNSIQTMWNTMPTNEYGKLEWRSLRYVAHRYFMHKSSMLIRGLEPQLVLNASTQGAADILSKQVPQHVDDMLGGEHVEKGYDIDDAASLLAALEQLVFDSETHLLEEVATQMRWNTRQRLNRKGVQKLLENYMVFWMLGEDRDSIRILMRNRTLLDTGFPHWKEIKEFVSGRVDLLNFRRGLTPEAESGRSLFDGVYSFDDAHAVVGGVTQTFQTFWESECTTMKEQLVAMDKSGTGRVRLSDFYGTGMDADWRFGEAEPYLRELGVLDETSPWLGKQVIIPNYLQAASNCIVSTPHYLICCSNECESLFRDVEEAIGTSMAAPQKLLDVIGNMTSPSSEDPPKLAGSLTEQLEKIAEAHGGMVPLHGRLFAQWMHYAFPRECPYPHKTGTHSQAQTLTPTEFGNYIASTAEMEAHVAEGQNLGSPDEETDQQWMSQWSLEEELFADYTQMSAPWEKSRNWLLWLVSAIALSGLVAVGALSPAKSKVQSGTPFFSEKQHLV